MASRGVSPETTGATNATQLHPFYVVVRCRDLSAWERRAGAERFPRRQDTDYRSVKCLPATKDEETRETAPRRIALVDPDCAFDASQRYDRYYEFDRVFDEHSTNGEVYAAAVAPLVSAVRRGVNGTCFAYGMTGAGKTFTMTGDATKGVQGVCSLAMQDLFCTAAAEGSGDVIQTVHASYLEIYNEKLRDLLLAPTATTVPRLDVIEDAERGVYVPNLTEVLVTTEDQIELLVAEGSARRVMAGTAANKASSRSHALLQLTVRRQTSSGNNNNRHQRITTGRLLLIDLAGSERAVVRPGYLNPHLDAGGFGASAHQQEVRRLNQLRNEGGNINRSLLALGACITALGTVAHNAGASTQLSHVPYRDSKLTRLLKDSLGGNTRTAMIAAVSPSVMCYEESLSTLKYASRARLITRTVRRNVTTDDVDMAKGYDGLIVALTAEVDGLRAQLSAVRSANQDALPRQPPAPASSSLSQRSSLSPIHAAHSPPKPSQFSSLQQANRSLSANAAEIAALCTGEVRPRPYTMSLASAKLKLADLRAQYLLLERYVAEADEQRENDVNLCNESTATQPPGGETDNRHRSDSPLASMQRVWESSKRRPETASDAVSAAVASFARKHDNSADSTSHGDARQLVERLRQAQRSDGDTHGRSFGAVRDHNAFERKAASIDESRDDVLRRLLAARYDAAAFPEYV